jgi:hypothetical protein
VIAAVAGTFTVDKGSGEQAAFGAVSHVLRSRHATASTWQVCGNMSSGDVLRDDEHSRLPCRALRAGE